MGLTPPIAATCLLRQARTRPSKCKKPSAAVCFLGDGASDEDAYRETVNAAGLWNLPTVFTCENNLCSDTASLGLTCVQKKAAAAPTPPVLGPRPASAA